MSNSRYVLITPARDEEDYIENLIKCVTSQTIRPACWIVVDDGSTDRTAQIVENFLPRYSWLKLIRNRTHDTRSFGSKAHAFKTGQDAIKGENYEFIGNLDADVTFDENYYESMIDEMNKSPKLGVVSGVVWQKEGQDFRRTISSLNHAVGAVQFWRRECFEEIGGYQGVSVGGMDTLAELTARMKGWQTRSLPHVPVYHHKPIDGLVGRNGIRISFRAGMTDYHMGTCGLMALMKAIRRWREEPILLGSVARFCGYMTLWATKANRDAPDELVRFVANEQKIRLWNALRGHFDCRERRCK